MSEVEKLYKNAGVGYLVEVIDTFPPIEYPRINFTAEKQLKILCYIVNNKHSVTFYDQVFGGDKLTLEKIQETLAWAINRIWQSLTEEERNSIKEILND